MRRSLECKKQKRLRRDRSEKKTESTLDSRRWFRTKDGCINLSGGITIRAIVTNFIRLDAQSVTIEVLIALGLVYGVLLILTLIDIVSRKRGLVFKSGWCVLAVGLPVVGMAFYCLHSISMVDRSFFERLKTGHGKVRKVSGIPSK